MRWKLALAGLTASWGFVAVLAASVELGAEALVFWRLALATGTLAVAALALRQLDLLAPRRRRARLGRARRADVLRRAAPDRAGGAARASRADERARARRMPRRSRRDRRDCDRPDGSRRRVF